MNSDRIEGSWKQFKENVKQQWSRLTDQLELLAGKRERPAGKIQESSAITKEQTGKPQ
jgi:uncharacterized protein YjbJ (UPF0337 family)